MGDFYKHKFLRVAQERWSRKTIRLGTQRLPMPRTAAPAHGPADTSPDRGRGPAHTTGVAFCGKYDMLLVAAGSLRQDPLMVSWMPLLQRVPPATPGNFPLS